MVEHEQKELTQQDFEELVAQAVKAPSGHNTQPWHFELSGNTIEIKPDFSRSLPVVDADNRELFVSLGCATENLCIAASHKGYDATVAVNETENSYHEISDDYNNERLCCVAENRRYILCG